MPNWCYNKIKLVTKDKELYSDWKELFSSVEFEFNEYVKPLSFCPNKSDTRDWWGTKWEITCSYLTFDDTENKLVFSYNTAWRPNDKVFSKFYNMIRERDSQARVEFYYEEVLSGFRGYYNNGKFYDYEIDNFYFLVMSRDNSVDTIERVGNKMLRLFHYDEAFIFLIKNSEKKKSCPIDGDYNYIEHNCFSETFGEDIVIVEHLDKFYIDYELL